MNETRFRGHRLTCDACGKVLRAMTVVVLRLKEAEHYSDCDTMRARRKAEAARDQSQGELF